MKRVLVLCTGNSCRSQMAEAILNHDLAPFVRAFSAGVAPQSEVAPNALEALRRAELPTDGLAPKDVAQFLDEPFDLVVTVCDHAREACPVFPRPIPTLHMAFPDPHGQRSPRSKRYGTRSAPIWSLRLPKHWPFLSPRRTRDERPM